MEIWVMTVRSCSLQTCSLCLPSADCLIYSLTPVACKLAAMLTSLLSGERSDSDSVLPSLSFCLLAASYHPGGECGVHIPQGGDQYSHGAGGRWEYNPPGQKDYRCPWWVSSVSLCSQTDSVTIISCFSVIRRQHFWGIATVSLHIFTSLKNYSIFMIIILFALTHLLLKSGANCSKM